MRDKTPWDTKLHSDPNCYPTYKSKDKTPREGQVVIASKLGELYGKQVIRRDNVLYVWTYETTDIIYCKVEDDYVWRGCGGFDF